MDANDANVEDATAGNASKLSNNLDAIAVCSTAAYPERLASEGIAWLDGFEWCTNPATNASTNEPHTTSRIFGTFCSLRAMWQISLERVLPAGVGSLLDSASATVDAHAAFRRASPPFSPSAHARLANCAAVNRRTFGFGCAPDAEDPDSVSNGVATTSFWINAGVSNGVDGAKDLAVGESKKGREVGLIAIALVAIALVAIALVAIALVATAIASDLGPGSRLGLEPPLLLARVTGIDDAGAARSSALSSGVGAKLWDAKSLRLLTVERNSRSAGAIFKFAGSFVLLPRLK